jgi:hypothetical protein
MADERRCERCGEAIPADAPGRECPRCLLEAGLAAQEEPFDREELSRAFPTLEIGELVGRGGMGVVYRARQRSLDREVALKVLPPEVAEDPAFADRFTREARALARLTHPNIVAVHEAGESGGLYYLVMEYVAGPNLRQAQAAGRLSPEEALAIVPQVCDALQYAHDRGVVHRDVKPENILLDRSGRVKIADFGLAKLLGKGAGDRTLTGTDQVMGTLHYMAPEQITSPLDVDHRADIYSLGVVFYEMLTGELPLGRFPPPSEKVRVDVRVDEVVLRTLEKERERRYQRAEEVKTGIGALSVTPPATGVPEASPPRTHPLAAAGVASVPAGVLLALIVFAIDRQIEEALLIAAVLFAAGLAASAWAWRTIRRSRGRYGGLGLAKFGVLAPLVTGVMGVGVVLLVSALLVADMARERMGAEIAAMQASVMEKVLRASEAGGDPDEAAIRRLTDPTRARWFDGLSEAERRHLSEIEDLGLLFVDPKTLPAPLSRFELRRSFQSGSSAEVTIGYGDLELTFPAVRAGDEWYLGFGTVLRMQRR